MGALCHLYRALPLRLPYTDPGSARYTLLRLRCLNSTVFVYTRWVILFTWAHAVCYTTFLTLIIFFPLSNYKFFIISFFSSIDSWVDCQKNCIIFYALYIPRITFLFCVYSLHPDYSCPDDHRFNPRFPSSGYAPHVHALHQPWEWTPELQEQACHPGRSAYTHSW